MTLRKEFAYTSTTLLRFTRAQPCAFCGHDRGSEAHHFPPKGRLGVRNDLRVLPACRACHRRCHGETVKGVGPIAEEDQTAVVLANLIRFVQDCTPGEWDRFASERCEQTIPF